MRSASWCLLLLSASWCLPGCGTGPEPTGVVTGQVVFQNQPVAGGTVIFQGADGGTSVQVQLTAEGTFRVATFEREGLPPGVYRVAVKPAVADSGEIPLAGAANEAGTPRPHPQIPARFHDPETSPLRADVRAGPNPPFRFDLSR